MESDTASTEDDDSLDGSRQVVIRTVQCIVNVMGEGLVIVEDLTIRVRG